jgi:catechol 2,3-dioxygenase-like lactoylglutathione lyase family enzyme
MADFYRDHLGMDEFHQDPDGSRFLTDGYINLALIQQHLDGDVPTGFNHFGFTVENIDTTTTQLTNSGLPRPAKRATNRPFAEYRAIDPEGNWFDLSAHGYLPPGTEE